MTVLAAVLGIKESPAQAGPLGLFIIILLGIGTWLLIRSMNRHLRKVPTSFDDQRNRPDDEHTDQPGSGGTAPP